MYLYIQISYIQSKLYINIYEFKHYMDKILVTGAAGFIGFSVCKRLLKLGLEVYGLDNLNKYYEHLFILDIVFGFMGNSSANDYKRKVG